MTKINIIGAGLAGSEAAWQLASRGFEVEIFEMRSEERKTFAHRTDHFAELVCSNSLRSDDATTAIGLLHHEMRLLDSLIMRAADANKIPAGSALAVDREGFSKFIESQLLATNKVKISRHEICELPTNSSEKWIIATGPLTSDALSQSILKNSGEEHLAFFDAIAPIIYKDSIDFSKAWFQSRYDKSDSGGDGNDYINCPLNREQYLEFVDDLLAAEKTEFKEWEKSSLEKIQEDEFLKNKKTIADTPINSACSNLNLIKKSTPYFDGCLPIEVMAARGGETLRFGPMKPVGLTNPHFPAPQNDDEKFFKNRPGKCHAVIQLRQDNKLGTLYNMVGFQTKMKYGDQQRVFRKIPGLENAEFARFGGIHRNTFINSPNLLDQFLRFKKSPNILFAGQITGVEGYVESAAMGLLGGLFSAAEIAGRKITPPTNSCAIGALLAHITQGFNAKSDFQPMNVNFGLFAPLDQKITKADRKNAYSARALSELENWKKFNL